MNTARLARHLRGMGNDVTAVGIGDLRQEDVGELLLVLARIVEGRTVEQAFGAPGDWGYSTPIGKALYAAPEAPAPSAEPGHSAGCECAECDRRAIAGGAKGVVA